ncbi:MAG: DUF3343 domain-containing protein [Oscillospiraceae bacterium]|nr:DUF3343 domain-containing protein [Oscillospiraceae bacterium]
MREKKPRVVVTFHTTAEAMATEKACRDREIEGRLISAPRELSADCGIAWCGAAETRGTLESALSDAKIEYAGIYEMEL